jgi:hypothetical protein
MNGNETKERKMRKVKEINNRCALNHAVDCLLNQIGESENALGESYEETADRIDDDHPRAAQYLREAETRWFELGD